MIAENVKENKYKISKLAEMTNSEVKGDQEIVVDNACGVAESINSSCLLYTSPSPRD